MMLVAVLLAACATQPPQADQMRIREGVIEQITPTQIQGSDHAGVGAILGGIAGIGLGSLIGQGTGRDVAMAAGAIGGTVAGAQAGRNFATPIAGQQIFVRTTSGVLVEVTQPVDHSLRVGQNVWIQGNGENARVIPR